MWKISVEHIHFWSSAISHFSNLVHLGDVEDASTNSQPVFWSREATELLIDLYEKHEEALEDSRKNKKDVWMLITGKINEAGYMFSQSKVEGK